MVRPVASMLSCGGCCCSPVMEGSGHAWVASGGGGLLGATTAVAGGGSAIGVGGGGGGMVGGSRRQFCGVMLCLAVLCSGAYLVLYYRATLAAGPTVFQPPRLRPLLQAPLPQLVTAVPDFASVPAAVVGSRPVPQGPIYNARWNVSEFATSEELQEAIANGTAEPLLTLFSTWSDRADLQQVRNFTLRNWRQLAPYVRPVLFINDSVLAQEAQGYGWHTLPVSRSAVGVPVLKFLYMDAMARFNSTLYAFANGDILFTQSLVDSLLAILTDPRLPLDTRPLLVVGQRINVGNVTEQEASNFANITRMAKARGKFFITMAEDFFITDKRFPWSDIPGVVIGRPAYDNWLVLNAIQNKYVVVDLSQTALAVHQTTSAGNHEGFSHPNSGYNDRMLTRMYKRVQYQGGCVDCAPWRTVQEKDGRMLVEQRTSKPKHCV